MSRGSERTARLGERGRQAPQARGHAQLRLSYNAGPLPAACGTALPPPHAPPRRHDLRQRVPAVPGPAGNGEADPALVRGLGRRVDDLPRVLPDDAARRLRILGLGRPSAGAACRRSACISSCCWSRSSLLPIIPAANWKPAGGEDPLWLILGLLAATIGLPYFLLSTTSPLVQAWFARARGRREPVSALRAVESRFDAGAGRAIRSCWSRGSPTRMQAHRLVVRLCRCSSGCARPPALRACGDCAHRRSCRSRRARPPAAPSTGREAPPAPTRQVLWCTLAATGSLLLLAVSNHITQNIASVPLLWIAPLAIYLLTFILCFDASGWYRRDIFLAMLAAGARRHGVDARRLETDARARAPDRRLLRRAFPRLHVLPRRARALEAGAEIPYALLPDDLARRGRRLGAGRASSRRSCFRPISSSRAGSSLCALLLLWQVRRDHVVFGVLAARCAPSRPSAAASGRYVNSTKT